LEFILIFQIFINQKIFKMLKFLNYKLIIYYFFNLNYNFKDFYVILN